MVKVLSVRCINISDIISHEASMMWSENYADDEDEFNMLHDESSFFTFDVDGEIVTMLFSFFPNPLGVISHNGQYGTVGILHDRCDNDVIKKVIDWYNLTTNDSRTFEDSFWYPWQSKMIATR